MQVWVFPPLQGHRMLYFLLQKFRAARCRSMIFENPYFYEVKLAKTRAEMRAHAAHAQNLQ